jgi:hypothetical protein
MIYKKIISILFLLLFVNLPAFAEKIPVKITPIQIISTHHDAIEVGDWMRFATVNDVYVDDKLYIQKNTDVIGIVDFVHPNGWGGDSADVVFKTFYTTDVNNKKVTISYPLNINGNLEKANNVRSVTTNRVGQILPYLTSFAYVSYVSFIVRGAEICVEPDTKIYNLFIEH